MSEGQIQIVLLPGMDGTGRLFANFVRAVPRGVEVKIITYPIERVQSYAQLLRFLQSSLPACVPFVLIAESFSSPLAIELAAMGATNFKGLVICAGFATSPVNGLLRLLCLLLSPVCFLIKPPHNVIRAFLLGSAASTSLVVAVRDAIASVRPHVLAHRLRLTLNCDSRSALSRVKAPILFIQPTDDKLVSAACLKVMRAIRPEATVELIAGPHLLLQARPNESAKVIGHYLQQFSME